MEKRLTRDTDRAMIAGVAAGWADYLGADLAIVRLVLVLLFLFGGIGLLLYVICWIVMPPREPGAHQAPAAAGQASQPSGPAFQPRPQPAAGDARPSAGPGNPAGRGGMVGGVILIVLGILLLGDQAAWLGWPRWARLTTLWPAVLIILGLYMVVVAARVGRRAPGS